MCERKQALFNRKVEAERQLSADLHIKKIKGSCAGHGMRNLDLCDEGHSRCLEAICGDFLYIAVIVIGAIRRSRDYCL